VRYLTAAVVFLLATAHAAFALADGFAAVVSPPRFELSSHQGATVRQVLEITNRSTMPARYRVHTADFTLGPDYGVIFQDSLPPGSCRPWVAIERPQVSLPAGATIRYRFEVQVPKDAVPGECRFGILIEAEEPTLAPAGAVKIPVVGRIGVIVYLGIGDAKADIDVLGTDVVTLNGERTPALRVHNGGNAHARMSGFLSGKDVKGAKYDFNPSDLPILPGEVREVFLTPSTPDNDHPTLAFPVTVQGTLEWGNQRTELDERFE
jgi:hypothetical protein